MFFFFAPREPFVCLVLDVALLVCEDWWGTWGFPLRLSQSGRDKTAHEAERDHHPSGGTQCWAGWQERCLFLNIFGQSRVLRGVWGVYTEMKDLVLNTFFQETSIFFHTNEKKGLGSAACDIFRMAFSRFLRFYFFSIIFMLTSVTEKVA